MPADLVDELAALPGVDRADGNITDQGTYVIGKDGKVIGSGGGAPGIGGNYNDAPGRRRHPRSSPSPRGTAPTGPGQLVIDEKIRRHQRVTSSATPSGWSPPAPSPR